MAPGEPPPRGRTPKGHVWKDGAFVHAESLSAYAREEHEALLKDNWRSARLKKYAENLDGRRDKLRARLAEKRRLGGPSRAGRSYPTPCCVQMPQTKKHRQINILKRIDNVKP